MVKIRDYFDFLDTDTWKCSLCSKIVRARSTSNLLQHFRTQHPKNFAEYSDIADHRPVPKYRKLENSKSMKTELCIPDDGDNLVVHETEDTEFDWAVLRDEVEENPLGANTEVRVITSKQDHNYTAETRVPDPLKLFFMSMYGTVRNLRPEQILVIRKRIFELVNEQEEQFLQTKMEMSKN